MCVAYSVLVLALATRAEVLVSFGGDYVSANVNCQGLSAGLVPWSMDSPRNPASDYTGPEFYGGAVVDNDGGGTGGWAQWRLVQSGPPDYLNSQKATNVQPGDKGTTVVMFKLAVHYAVTGASVRIAQYNASQINAFRIVAQGADDLFYVSDATSFDWDNTFVLDTSALMWHAYDPATNMSAIGAAAVWEPLDVQAVGVWAQNTATAGQLGIYLRGFEAAGTDAVPEPALFLPLLAGLLLRRRAA